MMKKSENHVANSNTKKSVLLAVIVAVVSCLVISLVILGIFYAQKLKPTETGVSKVIIGDAYIHAEDIIGADGRYHLLDYPEGDITSDYVELCDYKAMKVTVPERVEVTEDYIQAAMLDYIDYHDYYDRITEGTVAEGDYVLITYTSTYEDKVLDKYSAENAKVYVTDDLEPIEFYENLLGAKVGSTVTFDVMEDVSGLTESEADLEADAETDSDGVASVEIAEVHVSCEVLAILKAPELTDEVCSRITDGDCVTYDEFKEFIRQSLITYQDSEMSSAFGQNVIAQLLEECHFKTPSEDLLKWYISARMVHYQTQADIYGISLEEWIVSSGLSTSLDDLMYTLTQEAVVAVQRYAVLDAIAQAEGIRVNETDVEDAALINEHCESLCGTYNVETRAELYSVYGRRNVLHDIQNLKVLSWLEANLETVTEADSVSTDGN